MSILLFSPWQAFKVFNLLENWWRNETIVTNFDYFAMVSCCCGCGVLQKIGERVHGRHKSGLLITRIACAHWQRLHNLFKLLITFTRLAGAQEWPLMKIRNEWYICRYIYIYLQKANLWVCRRLLTTKGLVMMVMQTDVVLPDANFVLPNSKLLFINILLIFHARQNDFNDIANFSRLADHISTTGRT